MICTRIAAHLYGMPNTAFVQQSFDNNQNNNFATRVADNNNLACHPLVSPNQCASAFWTVANQRYVAI